MCSGICLRRRNKAWRHSTERRYHPSCSNMFHDPSTKLYAPKINKLITFSGPSAHVWGHLYHPWQWCAPCSHLSPGLVFYRSGWAFGSYHFGATSRASNHSVNHWGAPMNLFRMSAPTAKTLPKCWATSKTKRCSKPSTCGMTHFPIHVNHKKSTSPPRHWGWVAMQSRTGPEVLWKMWSCSVSDWSTKKQSLGCILQNHWSTHRHMLFQSSNRTSLTQPFIPFLLYPNLHKQKL